MPFSSLVLHLSVWLPLDGGVCLSLTGGGEISDENSDTDRSDPREEKNEDVVFLFVQQVDHGHLSSVPGQIRAVTTRSEGVTGTGFANI